jgi:hypothetical protein
MTLAQFIRGNRFTIDGYIRSKHSSVHIRLNDNERRLWVLNDATLFTWAKDSGVRV